MAVFKYGKNNRTQTNEPNHKSSNSITTQGKSYFEWLKNIVFWPYNSSGIYSKDKKNLWLVVILFF